VGELRRTHPRWGPRRIAHELGRLGCPGRVPSRMRVYRILVRHGLLRPTARRTRREAFTRWQRDAPMQLWQLDIVGGVGLVDPATGALGQAKVVTGIDDHSRYCVLATVVARATGRAVCLAFVAALGRYGVPEEVLSDNGKQFTARFGQGGEVLFDRICRDNGIAHRLTQPASPTTTGKVERFHQTLRRELLDDHEPFTSLAAAQTALDAWVAEYNTTRPHQALDMASPAHRFRPVPAAERAAFPLRLPAVLSIASRADPTPAGLPVASSDTQPVPSRPDPAASDPVTDALDVLAWAGGPVAFHRVVPPSGNLQVAGKQFWLGPARAGLTVTFWADTDLLHLLLAGARVKTVRSHLSVADLATLAAHGGRPAGPPPLPPPSTAPPSRSTGSSPPPGWSPSAAGPSWPQNASPASRSASASTGPPCTSSTPTPASCSAPAPTRCRTTKPAGSAAPDPPGHPPGRPASRSGCSGGPATPA
jgi:transposase InsO family protein